MNIMILPDPASLKCCLSQKSENMFTQNEFDLATGASSAEESTLIVQMHRNYTVEME